MTTAALKHCDRFAFLIDLYVLAALSATSSESAPWRAWSWSGSGGRGSADPPVTDARQRRRIERLRASGHSIRAIAEQVGVGAGPSRECWQRRGPVRLPAPDRASPRPALAGSEAGGIYQSTE